MTSLRASSDSIRGRFINCRRLREVNLTLHPAQPQETLATPVAHQWTRIDRTPWIQRHDLKSGSLLRLPDLADFLIDATGIHVDAWPTPGLDAGACEQLFRNNVLPMAFRIDRSAGLGDFMRYVKQELLAFQKEYYQ